VDEVSTLRFLRALFATNLKASAALRGAFLMQVAFMIANNMIFFVMWWVSFDHFDEVNGWRIEDMLAIYGMVAGSFGLSVVFGAGARDLTRLIVEGDLDSFLSQPKSPLLQTVASRSQASGWGDLVTAFLLMGLSGYLSVSSLLPALVGMVCGGVVLLATTVMIHCSAFWLSNIEDLSRAASEFIVLFSAYPKTIYSGALQVVLFTIIPAGFISFLPVDTLRMPGFGVIALVIGGAALYSGLAVALFRAGLRRYESGNRFGVRA